MRFKNFLGIFAILFILIIGVVSSEECEEVGEIILGQYCSSSGILVDLVEQGFSCSNNYECVGNSCVEGICGSMFEGIQDRSNMLIDIWYFFTGEECDPQFDTGYKCEGTIAFLCGADFVWEEKGEIRGVCGIPECEEDVHCNYNYECINNKCVLKNFPGGGGSDSIDIYFYSPKNITYSTKTIELRIKDRNNNARFWEYSLNEGNRIEFESGDYLTAKLGGNNLEVFASQYSSFYEEENEEIDFYVIEGSSNFYCGDDICDSSESCSNCEEDCGDCEIIASICGDGVCDDDESSFNCPEDCEVVPRVDRMWMFYVLVSLIIVAIIIIAIIIIKRIMAKHRPGGEDGLNYITHPPKKDPGKSLSPEKNLPLAKPKPFDMIQNKPSPIIKKGISSKKEIKPSSNSGMNFSRYPKRRGVNGQGNI